MSEKPAEIEKKGIVSFDNRTYFPDILSAFWLLFTGIHFEKDKGKGENEIVNTHN